MCGITGIVSPKNKASVEEMTRAILHRGPDDEGYFKDEHVALGMRRLSIIDLARGKQPITSTDGRFLIFFNGEIYNYKELKEDLGDYEFKPEVNNAAVFNYLSFQYNPLEETFFKNVFKLPSAHYMTIDAKTGTAEI